MANLTPTALSAQTGRECPPPAGVRRVGRAALVALLLAIVAIPLLYDRAARDPFTTPKKAAVSAAVCGLVAVVCLGRMGAGIRANRALLCMVLVFATGVASAASAASPTQAIENLRDWLLLATPSAILGCLVLTTPRRVLLCANALGLAAFAIAVVGILQHQRIDWWGYRPTPMDARGAGPAPSPDLLGVPVVEALIRGLYAALDALSRPDVDFSWAGPAGRFLQEAFIARPFARLPTQDGPASVFGHPNVAAEVVSAGLVALAVAARAAWRRGRGARMIAAAAGLAVRLFAIAVMAFYLAVTGTRGAWVALSAAALVLGLAYVLQGPRGRRLARLAVLLACVAAAGGLVFLAGSRIAVAGRGGGAVETPVERIAALFKPRDPSRDTILERLVLWENTHGMIEKKPGGDPLQAALGVGPGNWQVVYPLYHRSRREHALGTYTLQRYPDHPHQDALEFLAEYGLAGVVFLVLFLAAVLSRLLRGTRSGKEGERDAALLLLGVLTALLCVSLFSFPWHMPVTLFLAFLACGAALSVGPAPAAVEDAGGRDGAPGSRAPQIAFAGLLLAAIAALGGARAGAGAAAILGGAGALLHRSVPRPAWLVGSACAALFVLGAAIFPSLRSALGTFDAAVVLAALAVTGLASLPIDAPAAAGPRASRALAIFAMLAFTAASLGAGARVRASEEFQVALDNAWGARFIPGERSAAEQRARDAYDRATAANPADFLAEMSRSDFLSRTGFLADAEASALRVLRLHPWLINARVRLAWVAMKQGRDDASMQEARLARGLNPDTVEPRLLLGELFLRQGRSDLAAAEFERAVERSPKRIQPVAKIRAAEIYLGAGHDLAKALRNLGEAEREAASDPRLLAQIAALYSAPGSPPEIQAKGNIIWKRVAAMDPHDEQARLRVTIAPLLAGNPSRADLESILGTLEAFIRDKPDFDPSHVRAFRALTLERLGRREEALRAYREVVLLTAVAPFRNRADDEDLDAAIEALRALQAETRPDSSPTRPSGR